VEVEGGYRRIVATPKPESIVEIDAIKALLDADQVVIACGGGGIPVLEQDHILKGASAVIEKDTAAGCLADLVDADMLIILTGTNKVCINYGKENEKAVDYLSVADAKKYLQQGNFEEGTMKPKIQAAVDFIGDSAIRKTLIAKLNPDKAIIAGEDGTMIGK
jgi:carbamate kinase